MLSDAQLAALIFSIVMFVIMGFAAIIGWSVAGDRKYDLEKEKKKHCKELKEIEKDLTELADRIVESRTEKGDFTR